MADTHRVRARHLAGPEHYRKAQGLLAEVDRLDVGDPVIPEVTALAQVHATLALAAATATGVVADATFFGAWHAALRGGAS